MWVRRNRVVPECGHRAGYCLLRSVRIVLGGMWVRRDLVVPVCGQRAGWCCFVLSGLEGRFGSGAIVSHRCVITVPGSVGFVWSGLGAHVGWKVSLTWTQGQILDFSFLGVVESISRAEFRRFM